jgi:hypothetical protein
MTKIAIVGSDGRFWQESQIPTVRHIIKKLLTLRHNAILVSGACPLGGVDLWAEQEADLLKLKKEIYPPEKPEKFYFFKRNKQIAEACDELYCIEPTSVERSGGQHALHEAKKLEKPTQLIKIALDVVISNEGTVV